MTSRELISREDFNPRSPCGERPRRRPRSIKRPRHFNPRSPCGERLRSSGTFVLCIGFQSTLPVWGATTFLPGMRKPSLYFNPRSPCGERLNAQTKDNPNLRFQSTLPVWGATLPTLTRPAPRAISIHAPRVGSDRIAIDGKQLTIKISIHAPRVGSDDILIWRQRDWKLFQSTLPVWGATLFSDIKRILFDISIHAPRVGSDPPPIYIHT